MAKEEKKDLTQVLKAVKQMKAAPEVSGVNGGGTDQYAWVGLDKDGNAIYLLTRQPKSERETREATGAVITGEKQDGGYKTGESQRFASVRAGWRPEPPKQKK